MATTFDAGRYRHSIDNWWLSLLLGILFFIVGIIVFFRPGDSYLALSVLFGIVVILSGILEIYLGANATGQSGRGWLIAGGVIEILLGLLMLSTPSVLLSVLPYVLGFWLLFRGFTSIGLASDMNAYGVQGSGWTVALGVLVIICAFFILFNPVLGIGVVVLWLGLSLLFAGINLMVHAAHLRRLKRHLE